MIRHISLLAAFCLVICCVGCITMQDADGKGSRKLIVPLLTVVGKRTDDKGETRTITIIPLATTKRVRTRIDGVVTERTAVVPLLSFWRKRTDAAGYEKKEVFVAPLLLIYESESGFEEVGGVVIPGEVSGRRDMQSAIFLSGFHRKEERGVVSSWGYINLLLGYSRSGGRLKIRLFHIIPLPPWHSVEEIPHPD